MIKGRMFFGKLILHIDKKKEYLGMDIFYRMEHRNFIRVFSEIFCLYMNGGRPKFVQYIRMLSPGRFILIESVQ